MSIIIFFFLSIFLVGQATFEPNTPLGNGTIAFKTSAADFHFATHAKKWGLVLIFVLPGIAYIAKGFMG